jgi:hypothetical protein
MKHYCAVGSKYILERSNTLIARSKFQHMQGGPQGLVLLRNDDIVHAKTNGPACQLLSSIGPVVHLDFGGFSRGQLLAGVVVVWWWSESRV